MTFVAFAARRARAADPKPSKGDLGPTMQAIAMLMSQATQWTAGDLTGFCAHYADDATFVSPTGLTKGRAAVVERYAKKYANGKTPPPGPNPEAARTMGALSFEILDARGDDRFSSIVMRWTLEFAADTKKPKATGFSAVALEKLNGKWMIVQDASM
jgi:ketosteroid isomerase-like protein